MGDKNYLIKERPFIEDALLKTIHFFSLFFTAE
jgi:hypothetical protein